MHLTAWGGSERVQTEGWAAGVVRRNGSCQSLRHRAPRCAGLRGLARRRAGRWAGHPNPWARRRDGSHRLCPPSAPGQGLATLGASQGKGQKMPCCSRMESGIKGQGTNQKCPDKTKSILHGDSVKRRGRLSACPLFGWIVN